MSADDGVIKYTVIENAVLYIPELKNRVIATEYRIDVTKR
jgi:hypothetical protein